MQRRSPRVRVHGNAAGAEALRTRVRALGLDLVEGAADVELAVDAADVPVESGPVVLVSADRAARIEALRAARVADALDPGIDDEELRARLERLARAAPEEAWHSELEQLLALIRDLATSGDLPGLLLRIVRNLADAAGVERCSLVLIEGDATHGLVVASSDRAGLQSLPIALADYPEIREARRTGAPVIVSDATHHPLLDPVRRRLEKAGVGAVACFPLHVDGDFLGVLMMRARTAFGGPRSVHLASTAAIATAIAVRHARLVEDARSSAAREMARYEAFVSQLTDGVAVLGDGHRVTLLNPAGAAILGVRGDVRGKPFFELAKATDALGAQLLAREISRGARVLSADLEVELPEGKRAVLAVSAGPLKRGDDGLAILSFRDVTEERAIEAELRRTRDFQERLIDASGDAIIAADLKGRILVFNRAAEQLYGMSAADVRQSVTARDLYPQGGAQEVMRLLREAPKGRIEAVRCYARTRDGEIVPIELSAALIKVGGREEATVGLMRDLRERVRVESELARTRAQLIDAEKQKAVTALAGATAHELNQPLTVVIGYAELLRRRVTDEACRKPLESIYVESERMAHIVKKIAKLTRVETVSYPGERQIADLERSSEPPPVKPR